MPYIILPLPTATSALMTLWCSILNSSIYCYEYTYPTFAVQGCLWCPLKFGSLCSCATYELPTVLLGLLLFVCSDIHKCHFLEMCVEYFVSSHFGSLINVFAQDILLTYTQSSRYVIQNIDICIEEE